VLGPEEGMALCRKYPGVEVLIFDMALRASSSPGFPEPEQAGGETNPSRSSIQ